MRQRFLLFLVAALVACTCTAIAQVLELPSGRHVNIIGVTKMYSTNGKNSWLILDYRTNLAITNIEALKKEADQIWPYFKNIVEQAGMDEALIRANSEPTGVIFQTSKAFAVPYEQAADGTWSRVGD